MNKVQFQGSLAFGSHDLGDVILTVLSDGSDNPAFSGKSITSEKRQSPSFFSLGESLAKSGSA